MKGLEDFDFIFQPSINKDQILDFKNLRFVEKMENILFLGNPGVGKTHLSIAIGLENARNKSSTYFINCNDLIQNLKKANFQNRFEYLEEKEFSGVINLVTPSGMQETRVFTEDGIYGVTMLARTEKAKEFRAFVRKVLKSLRKGETKLINT